MGIFAFLATIAVVGLTAGTYGLSRTFAGFQAPGSIAGRLMLGVSFGILLVGIIGATFALMIIGTNSPWVDTGFFQSLMMGIFAFGSTMFIMGRIAQNNLTDGFNTVARTTVLSSAGFFLLSGLLVFFGWLPASF